MLNGEAIKVILHDPVGERQLGPDKAGKPNLTLRCDWVKEEERCRERGMSLVGSSMQPP